MAVVTPLGALARGFAAGAAGSALQYEFFKHTRAMAPAMPKEAFEPPEPDQQNERPLQTVARRLVEDVAQRGPLDEMQKQRLGTALHYAFGGSWGGLYGLARESIPSLCSAKGTIAFSTIVWMVSQNGMLPLLKLAGWPQQYPVKNHAYAWAAHLAYGFGTWGTYLALRPKSWTSMAAALFALRARRKVARVLPKRIRPAAAPLVNAAIAAATWRPILRTPAVLR